MRNGRYKEHGFVCWYVKGKLHRLEGPAQIWPDGCEEWYIDGIRHRQCGPARIWLNGYQEWWVDGERITRTHLRLLKLRDFPKTGFTDEQLAMLRIMR